MQQGQEVESGLEPDSEQQLQAGSSRIEPEQPLQPVDNRSTVIEQDNNYGQDADKEPSSSSNNESSRVGRLGRRIITPKKLKDFVCNLYNKV